MLSTKSFRETKSYQLLKQHFESLKSKHLFSYFQEDENRFQDFSLSINGILFDYSKNKITKETLSLFTQLLQELDYKQAINNLFEGEKINRTENRAVLHTALRNKGGNPVFDDGKDIMPEILEVLSRMKKFSTEINSGTWKGYSGKRITDVVNIGIGGSDLGPVMVTEALKKYHVPDLNSHFVSNVDGTHLIETLKNLNPETTFFLIASKTFTTQETMTNAYSARAWFLEKAIEESCIAKHFAAMSTAKNEVEKFGINETLMFPFWDWVGGRYSLWSAIGLSICIAIGYDNFDALLNGAFAADTHFKTEEAQNNIPILMAIIGFWYGEFFQYSSQAIIPYDQYMHRFAAYLQQADMESNGKCVSRNGNKIDYNTGQIIWGEPGTNGQHAFFQLLHQGTQIIPADFIAPVISLNPTGRHHEILLSNFFAQTEALMKGKSETEVRKELFAKGMSETEILFHLPYRVFDGNRPSNTFLMNKIDPYHLGMLIAFYEHKIFIQGLLWNVFSFDQWGVELGKKLASVILPELSSEAQISSHDSSTNGLINHYKKIHTS